MPENTMTYAGERLVYDADSHLMEGFDWLASHADAATRERLPDLTSLLGRGGANAVDRARRAQDRVLADERRSELEANVIGSAKGWDALGAMHTADRSRALDLLGFQSQLVFSTFSVGLFAFAGDPDLVYGGAAAHNRMVSGFCDGDDRLVAVAFLPLDDPERSITVVDEALDLGCGAFWVAHNTSAKRSPAHTDNDPVWQHISDAGVPIVLHIGGGRNGLSRSWHNNGRPLPPDLHGGGENLRAKDFPVVHHAAESYLTCLVLDGVLERFPALRVGVIELGATWAPGLMDRLDHAARSFSKTEPLLAELSLSPSDYIRRQVRFTPFPGEDVGKLIALTGPALYLFSSDYPHPEGTRDPLGKFETALDEHDVDDDARRLFYADNYRALVGR